MSVLVALASKVLDLVGLKKIVNEKYDKAVNLTKDTVDNVVDTTYKGGLFSMIIVTIGWLSIFLYIAFYYAYMPSLVLNRPIHMQFKNCYSEKQLCDYPSGHVKLNKNQQLLMIGQKYKMIVYIDLPESPTNEKIGMFMLCIRLSDKYGYLVSSSCRSNRLTYRSTLYHLIRTIFMVPFYLTGFSEEKQMVQFEMYTEFEEDQLHPVTDIYFELLDYEIQIYSANIKIIANLSGLRYLMFHWPILSAFLGIGSNLLFVFLVFSMSWRHIYGAEICKNEPNDLLDICEVFDDYETDEENESTDSCKKPNVPDRSSKCTAIEQ